MGSGPAEPTSLGHRVGRAPLPYVAIERSPSGGLVVERGGFGGRPAYVRSKDGVVLASTDLSWMLEASRERGWSVSFDPDRLASECFFDAGPVGRTQTLFREIQEIPPATRARLLPGLVERVELQPLAVPRLVEENETHRVAHLRALLSAAIARAVEGAQSVGVLAGGGLDSGALLALAHARVPRTNAFAIDLESDRPHLAALALALGIEPIRAVTADVELPPRLTTAGLPLTWPSGAMEAHLLRRAHEWGASIVLAGLGADEHFDGHPEAASLLLASRGVGAAVSAARRYDDAGLRLGLARALWPRLRRAVPRGVRHTLRRRHRPSFPAWAGPRSRQVLADARERALAEEPWVERTAEERIRDGFVAPHLARASALRLQLERLSGTLRIDPYLDAELATFALGSSPEELFGGGGGGRRGLFREALAGVLPESLRTRGDKASFAPVHRALFCSPLLVRLEAYASVPHLADLGIVEPAAFRRAFDETVAGAPVDARVYAVLAVEAFLRA